MDLWLYRLGDDGPAPVLRSISATEDGKALK